MNKIGKEIYILLNINFEELLQKENLCDSVFTPNTSALSPLTELKEVLRMVDDEEGGGTVVVLREPDGSRVLRQVHVYYYPAHLWNTVL